MQGEEHEEARRTQETQEKVSGQEEEKKTQKQALQKEW